MKYYKKLSTTTSVSLTVDGAIVSCIVSEGSLTVTSYYNESYVMGSLTGVSQLEIILLIVKIGSRHYTNKIAMQFYEPFQFKWQRASEKYYGYDKLNMHLKNKIHT